MHLTVRCFEVFFFDQKQPMVLQRCLWQNDKMLQESYIYIAHVPYLVNKRHCFLNYYFLKINSAWSENWRTTLFDHCRNNLHITLWFLCYASSFLFPRDFHLHLLDGVRSIPVKYWMWRANPEEYMEENQNWWTRPFSEVDCPSEVSWHATTINGKGISKSWVALSE